MDLITTLRAIPPIVVLLVATTLEVTGDAIVRIALYDRPGITVARVGLFALGAAFLFGYGSFVNLTALEFRRVVGLYIATLFVVWQIINFAFLRTAPTLPICVGGALIVIGGGIVAFWSA